MSERKLKIDKVMTCGGTIERDCVHFDGADDTSNILLIDWHGRRITLIDNIDPDMTYIEGHQGEPGLSILYDPCKDVFRDIEIAGKDSLIRTICSYRHGEDEYSELTETCKCKDVAEGLKTAEKNAKKIIESKNNHA